MNEIMTDLDPGERAEFQAAVSKTVDWMLRTGSEREARQVFGDPLVDRQLSARVIPFPGRAA